MDNVQTNDYSTPIPQGATVGSPVGNPTQTASSGSDDYSTPIPQGASVGKPAPQPKPGVTMADVSNALDVPGNLETGALHGLAQTGAGIMGIAEKLANPSGDPNNERPWFKATKDWLNEHSQNTGTDTASRVEQGAGKTIEGLGEWLLGDEALKGATLSERLLTTGKIAKTIESSPRLATVVKAGLQALGRGAALGGAQAAVKSGGDPTAIAGGAAAGGAGNVLIPGAINSARELPALFDTLKGVIKPGIIQDSFQSEMRDLLNDAAREAGVNPSGAASIRDVANDVSNALQSRAKSAYQALDDAMGGRAQRFKDAIRNVQAKITELNGIDPDNEGKYVEKLNDLTDAHQKAMDEASNVLQSQGRNQTAQELLDRANGDFRKSKAMLDLSKNIRASSEGLRPELAGGARKPMPERLNPAKLNARVNKMYDAGRLQDAIGEDRSQQMLRSVNDAHAASQTAQNIRGLVGSAAKHVGYYGLTWEFLRHMLGD